MLAYVREIARTGGRVAESLKHLSFLLASPCGAQTGYFCLEPSGSHLGFQQLTPDSGTQSPSRNPGLFHKGTVAYHRGSTQRANARLQ